MRGWESKIKSDIFLVILCYVVLVAVKLIWVSSAPGPILFYDEFLYKTAAQSMAQGKGYTVDGAAFTLYPPLYPLALVPAFLSTGQWYQWILVINVLISSAVIFPVWAIARLLLPRRESFACVLASAVIPFQAVSSRMVMSENLFMPLFALAVYTLVRDTSRPSFLSSVSTGAVWALAYLTRHIFLVAIPVCLLVWWIQPWVTGKVQFSDLFRRRLLYMIWVMLGLLVTYAPWVLYSMQNGLTALNAMGLTMLGAQQSRDLFFTVDEVGTFVVWIGLFISYFLLSSALYVQFSAAFLFSAWRQADRRGLFFVLTLLGLSAAFIPMAAFWHWGVFGTRWTELYIDGRYMMYPVPLLPILAFVVLQRLAQIPSGIRWRALALGGVISAVLVSGAYTVLIIRPFFGLPAWFVNIPWVSMDVMTFNATAAAPLGIGLLAIFFAMLVVQSIGAALSNRYTWLVVLATLLIFEGAKLVHISQRFPKEQERAWHGVIVRDLLTTNHWGDPKAPIRIALDANTYVGKQYLEYSLNFWNIQSSRFSVVEYAQDTPVETRKLGTGLFLTRAQYPDPLVAYRVDDAIYYIYELPIQTNSITKAPQGDSGTR